MIGYLKGKVVQKLHSQILVIDVQGVGYEVACPVSTADGFLVGDEAAVYVSSQTRTDGTFLYGFQSPVEKLLFLQLIKVDSVGPKMALTVLSSAPADELARLINEGDTAALVKLPKVGKRTAEQMAVKLKGKLDDIIIELSSVEDGAAHSATGDIAGGTPSRTRMMPGIRSVRGEAVATLSHLGFKAAEIERALDEVSPDTWSSGLESVIREALRSVQT